MGLSVELERMDGLLVVTGTGPGTLADFKGFADLIARVAFEEKRPRALIDLQGVTQTLSFTEHLQLGAYIAERLAFLSKVATVVPVASRSGNSERAAQKSGLKLRTFTDMAEALAWVNDPA